MLTRERAEIVAHRENAGRVTLNCGHLAIPDYSLNDHYAEQFAGTPGEGVTGFPGYATTPEGYTLCPECATRDEAEFMLTTSDVIGVYVNKSRNEITGWLGNSLGRVTRLTYSAYRYGSIVGKWRMRYVRVRDVHGHYWSGQGSDRYDAITLRRVS